MSEHEMIKQLMNKYQISYLAAKKLVAEYVNARSTETMLDKARRNRFVQRTDFYRNAMQFV